MSVPMDWLRNLAHVSRAERLVEQADAEGAEYAPRLLECPARTWRRMMRSDPHYRSYGTLKFLIDAAVARFHTEPTMMHEILAAVLDFVDETSAPSHIHHVALRALAWKEYSNACEAVGDLRTALSAAEHSVTIYAQEPSLQFFQAQARLAVCKVLRELGETDQAMKIVRECAEVFEEFGDITYKNMARIFEATILFGAKRFHEALAIFMAASEEAEAAGDRLTLAKCLQCAAQCARSLGDLESALDLFPRAMKLYEELNILTDANTARWGYALSLAQGGTVPFRNSISELFKVRAIFLGLGMNSRAACAALDIVRLRFDHGEDVRELCAEIIQVLTTAGLTQNAIEALAYLREQAKQRNLSPTKISRVRTFFDQLEKRPALLFARPNEEEEG